MPVLIDTHAHLNDGRFESDRTQMMERATSEGLIGILTIGIDLESSRECLALAESSPIVWAAVGIHPNNTAEAYDEHWTQIVEWANLPRVVAIGESGLDRHWDKAPIELQEEYFRKHLALSRATGKPIIIHCREAAPDVVRVLTDEFQKHGPISGVMHSFCEDQDTAEKCLAMGLHISFSGILTYKTAQNIRDVAKTIPADRILVETDCPYLPPIPHRGKRNEPAYVALTAHTLAEVRGVTLAEIGETTTANANRLFGMG